MSTARRHAPAFQVSIGPQPLLQGLVAAVAGLSTGCAVAALVQHQPALMALFALAPVAAFIAGRLARVRPRHLLWDGQVWRLADSLSEPGRAVQPEVLIDLDHWLLLRAGCVYLPLARKFVGPAWGQLRATLYAAR